jgi:hypothetical protein
MAILSNKALVDRRVLEPRNIASNGRGSDEESDVEDNVLGEQDGTFPNLGANGEISTGEDNPPADDSQTYSCSEAGSDTYSCTTTTSAEGDVRTTEVSDQYGGTITANWPPDVDERTITSVERETCLSMRFNDNAYGALSRALDMEGFTLESSDIRRVRTREENDVYMGRTGNEED